MPPRLALMEPLMTTTAARAPQDNETEDEDQEDGGTKDHDDDGTLGAEAMAAISPFVRLALYRQVTAWNEV